MKCLTLLGTIGDDPRGWSSNGSEGHKAIPLSSAELLKRIPMICARGPRRVGLLAVHAHRKHLELGCVVASDVPPAVVGGPARLRQVILNLVGTAVKFTAAGEVVLELALGATTASELTVIIRVRDTGIGIPAASTARIFEAFTQWR